PGFLARFDDKGKAIWSKLYDATCSDAVIESGASDSSHNFVVSGHHTGVDFGNGELSFTGPGVDAFIAKVDTNGKAIWSRSYGDAREQAEKVIGVDHNDTVLVGGYFDGAIARGGGLLTASSKSTDVFLAKPDSNASPLWSKRFGSPNPQPVFGQIAEPAAVAA